MRGTSRTILAALLLSACASPEFLKTVESFSATTESAVTTQNQRLAMIDTLERQDLARNRVALVQSPGCVLLAIPGNDPRNCVIQRKDGRDFATTRAFTNITKLNAGVVTYAKSLRRLASDQAEDKAKYSAALTEMAGALDQLQTDINIMRQERDPQANPQPSVSGLGLSILDELTTLAFDAQRANALRRIIIAADPAIQDAMDEMSNNNRVIGATNVAYYTDALDEVKKDLDAASRRRAPVAQISELQGQMFSLASALRSSSAYADVFPKLKAAHTDLATSAKQGADRQAMNAAINRIADAVKAVQAAQPDDKKE